MSVVWAVLITITYYRTCVFARTVTHFVRQTRSVHQVLSVGACDNAKLTNSQLGLLHVPRSRSNRVSLRSPNSLCASKRLRKPLLLE